jgi:DNA-binding NtrC family response regulator
MAVPTNVIMAGKHVSTSSYISAIEHGAFGFVVPPIETTQVSHAVLMAAEKARRCRQAQALKSAASPGHSGIR